jgi:hypothetical protein
MAKYLLVVQSSPTPGKEDEYNRWYNDVHLKDVLKIPGMVSAERMTLVPEIFGDNVQHRYLAIYTAETDDPKTIQTELMRRSGTAEMTMSDALGAAVPTLYKLM